LKIQAYFIVKRQTMTIAEVAKAYLEDRVCSTCFYGRGGMCAIHTMDHLDRIEGFLKLPEEKTCLDWKANIDPRDDVVLTGPNADIVF
jgi:hypothetical protein